MTQNTKASHGPKNTNTRLDIARALTQVIGHGRTIDWVRAQRPQWLQSSLHSELLYGTLRHYLSLTDVIQKQLKRPLKTKDLDLERLCAEPPADFDGHTSLKSRAARQVNTKVPVCR